MKKLVAFVCLVACFYAKADLIPEWLPEDYRFNVVGSSNEVAEVNSILVQMRDNINPQFRPYIDKADMLGPYLQWIVRWAKVGLENEKAYLSKAAHPTEFTLSDFNVTTLTNFTAKFRYFSPQVKLSLVYDDKNRNAVTRTVPGVDYPGVATEEGGSTPHCVRFVLCAPKQSRRLRLRITAVPFWGNEVEFKWVVLQGSASVPSWERREIKKDSQLQDIFINYDSVKKGSPVVIAVFAREKGRYWGPPSFVQIERDPLSTHTYIKNEIYSIDYGAFEDFYKLDEKGRILGFNRRKKDSIDNDDYSNNGELIVESYPNDMPKTAKKVEYFIDNNKLNYKVLDDLIEYKYAPPQYRPYNW